MTIFQDKSNPLVGRLVRAAVRLGLGRGRLKQLFAKVWQVAVGTGPVDVVYHGIKLRLFPVGNTIESKFCSVRVAVKAKSLTRSPRACPRVGCFSILGPILAIIR